MEDKWAENELRLLKESNHNHADENDPLVSYADLIADSLAEIMEVFDRQEHSGMSASLMSGLLSRLIARMPLTPLTGAEDEWGDWEEIGEEKMRQNKRYCALFQHADGRLHDNNRVIYVDSDSGLCYHHSVPDELMKYVEPIEFPYLPANSPYKIYAHDTEDGKIVCECIVDPKGCRRELNVVID